MQAREQSVGRAMAPFALTGLAGVLLLGFVAVQLLRSTGTREAINDAKRLSRLAGDAIVVPQLNSEILRGDPSAVGRLEDTVRRRLMDRGSIVRVKVWDGHGRIVWSDE